MNFEINHLNFKYEGPGANKYQDLFAFIYFVWSLAANQHQENLRNQGEQHPNIQKDVSRSVSSKGAGSKTPAEC